MGKMAVLAAALIVLVGCTMPVSQSEIVSDKKENKLVTKTEERLTEAKNKTSGGAFMLKGEIDTLREIEVFSQTEGETVITLVGFKNGEGVIIAGIYPGLKVGKRVKIHLKPSLKKYKGTAIHEAVRIEADTSE
jgi:hypothetical protein